MQRSENRVNQNSMQTSTNTEVLNNILKAIDGEYTAISCYELLANQAPNNEIKKRILEIRKDEIRHYETFWYLYISLTGEQPSPKITRQCPADYTNGILSAFKDEQETVDFYHKIARSTDNPFINDAFTRASADEQNHAVWFLYFMNHQ
ncbi:ferritin family protein [Sporosarcina koreensis]|uniref:ferritin family protein n=1 Tax=Bacillales TaxID=1385 RepID=UPI0039C9310D